MTDAEERSKNKSIFHSEMERRSNDLVIVFNPTKKDKVILWDKAVAPKVWRVKSKEEEIVPRYIMIKYLKEMIVEMVYNKVDIETRKENERRIEAGLQPMNKWHEQWIFEIGKLADAEKTSEKVVGLLYRGLYREYGIDPVVTEELKEEGVKDKRPLHERLADKVMATEEMVVPTKGKRVQAEAERISQ